MITCLTVVNITVILENCFPEYRSVVEAVNNMEADDLGLQTLLSFEPHYTSMNLGL